MAGNVAAAWSDTAEYVWASWLTLAAPMASAMLAALVPVLMTCAVSEVMATARLAQIKALKPVPVLAPLFVLVVPVRPPILQLLVIVLMVALHWIPYLVLLL
ncbi:MAG: hypothetical protein ACRET0_08775 [Steroidobacteraceae bacterium]